MSNGREVDLRSRLAQLADTSQGAPGRQQRAGRTCRNPECVKGMTPGAIATGRGNKGAPIFGDGGTGTKNLMRWGWVTCLACNISDAQRRAGASYKHLNLSDNEIAQRAEMANGKAPYVVPEGAPRRGTLGLSGVGRPPPPPPADDGKLAELVEQNKKLMEQLAEMNTTMGRLTMQVAGLLEDNRKLQAELNERRTTTQRDPEPTPPRHDMGG